eukprot:m.98353 g.98353  ORF g.98353 m.98353 type:complete len:179 (+) comp15556_c5_seq6:616-1152(+)
MKIVVVGSGGVGKSCCTLRYLNDVFAEDYDPTIEECFSTKVQVDNKKISLEIIDTAGQEEFAGFRDVTIHYGDGFLIVYAVDDATSWKSAQELKGKIDRIKSDSVPAVMLGNKADLDKREVDAKDVDAWCANANVQHIQASAKTNLNIKQAFETLIRAILKRQQETGTEEKKKGCTIL